ncbi:hypothetical protein JKG47_03655 [Acidithiobacillus sp. MC6.1]|nr:hypothetical protein [Acidithiobacillus sp. MC6.1]
MGRKMQRWWTASGLILGASMALAPMAQAEPAGVARLAHILKVENGGVITRVFRGPDDFTGVMMHYKNQMSMGFITPDGKYFMVGAMMNLRNGELVNQKVLAKQLKKQGIVVGLRAMDAIELGAALPAITYGPENAKNTITVLCDPSTHKGQVALVDMLHLMEHFYQKTPAMKTGMALRVVPTGPDAAWILSTSNLGGLKRLKSLIDKNRVSGSVTTLGKNNAAKINDALKSFPMQPPFVLMNLPQGHLEFVMNASHAIQTLERSEGQPVPAHSRAKGG